MASRYHEVYAGWQADPETFWAEAARAAAEGVPAVILSDAIEGEARDVGKMLAGIGENAGVIDIGARSSALAAPRRDPHVDPRAQHRIAGRVLDHHIHRQGVAGVSLDRRTRGRRGRAHRADRFLQVFDGHALGNPAH